MTHEGPEEDWMRVLDVNLNGVWRSHRAQLKVMMKQEYDPPFPSDFPSSTTAAESVQLETSDFVSAGETS